MNQEQCMALQFAPFSIRRKYYQRCNSIEPFIEYSIWIAWLEHIDNVGCDIDRNALWDYTH